MFRTICWTPRWSNKPKFHYLLHLPAHIRRFGPALLFATESFESFNAVIRAKSVHSNRLAPSRDIATAFAHNNRVRHLLSGGQHFFRDSELSQKYVGAFSSMATNPTCDKSSVHAGEAGIWRQVSSAATCLIEDDSPIASYMGLNDKHNDLIGKCNIVFFMRGADRFEGTCKLAKEDPRPYDHTTTAQHFPSLISPPSLPCMMGASIVLRNGDVCYPGSWVLFKSSASDAAVPALGRVCEIITCPSTAGIQQSTHPHILLQNADIGACVQPYQMPAIHLNNWVIADISVSDVLCYHDDTLIFPTAYFMYCKCPTPVLRSPLYCIGIRAGLPGTAGNQPNSAHRPASFPRQLDSQHCTNARCHTLL
jgi:hypothetical protein